MREELSIEVDQFSETWHQTWHFQPPGEGHHHPAPRNPRWSAIASHLPGRTDNDVKNVWNHNLKRRLQSKAESQGSQSGAANPTLFPNPWNQLIHSKEQPMDAFPPSDHVTDKPQFIDCGCPFSSRTDDDRVIIQQGADNPHESQNMNENKLLNSDPRVAGEMLFWEGQNSERNETQLQLRYEEHNSELQYQEHNSELYEIVGEYINGALDDTYTEFGSQVMTGWPSQNSGTSDRIVDHPPSSSNDCCSGGDVQQIMMDNSMISCRESPNATSPNSLSAAHMFLDFAREGIDFDGLRPDIGPDVGSAEWFDLWK